MKRFDLWKLSLLNVFSAPVRSMLTVLGFAIGVAAILAVLTLGEAGKQQVQSEMGRLGIDKVWLTASEGENLQRGDGHRLQEMTGAVTDEFIYLPAILETMRGRRESATVAGCSLEAVDASCLTEGRMPWPLEWRRDGQTVLIGERTAEKLNITVGDVVQIAQKTFRVCGIIGAGEGFSRITLEDAVIMPIDAACLYTDGAIHEIQLTTQTGAALEMIEQLAVQTMQRWGTTVNTMSMQAQMQAASSVITTFVNVLKWVSLVCILVGGIGVMNILLIGVRERKREIGVMKSLGTTPVQICLLFLLEALVYAVIGGFLGILLGFALIHAAGSSIELIASASAADCISVFVAAIAIGLFFGVLPAFRASMLKCVDALRQE